MIGKLERLVLVQWKIRLLINPIKPDHQELYAAIDNAFKRIQTGETSESETDIHVENITRLSQAILKREWERVNLGI